MPEGKIEREGLLPQVMLVCEEGPPLVVRTLSEVQQLRAFARKRLLKLLQVPAVQRVLPAGSTTCRDELEDVELS